MRRVTKEEVNQLLNENTSILTTVFWSAYEQKFGRCPSYKSGKLVDTLKSLSNKGNFIVEEQSKGSNVYWIIKNLPKRSKKRDEICELLKENGGELNGAHFRSKFEQKFGRDPLPGVVKLTKPLQKLSCPKTFQVEARASSLWIVLSPNK